MMFALIASVVITVATQQPVCVLSPCPVANVIIPSVVVAINSIAQ